VGNGGSTPGPLPSLDAFQNAFAAYLARNVSLDQLRRVVVNCVVDARILAQVMGNSFAAAVEAHCLPTSDYRVLQADLFRLAMEGAPRVDSPNEGDDAIGSGRVLRNRYLLKERIAAGGIGTLYRAVDLSRADHGVDKGTIAIKMLCPEYRHCPDAIRSLRCEARTARQLSHPNIRAVHHLDRCATDFFITMDWLDGESLAARLDRTGSRGMPWAAAKHILWAIGAGLTHAHRRGIVHGDVKPGNVFVTVGGQVKLLDFGQARTLDAERGPMPRLAVSPAYASCELHEGGCAEVRDDVFALAVMAYRILAGARPFGRYTPLKAERAGITALPPAILGASQWRVLQQGLAWRREQRPASVREFLEGLLRPPVLLHAAVNSRCTSQRDGRQPPVLPRSSIVTQARTV